MIQEKKKNEKTKTVQHAMREALVQNIICAVETAIHKELNMRIKLQVVQTYRCTPPDVNNVMQQIAEAMNMKMADYGGGRTRKCADLRRITCYIIKLLYPDVPIAATACALGIHHSAVIYHIKSAREHLEINDQQFVKKYTTVLNTLNYVNKN